MPVTVDSEPLLADQLGLHTVGQVLSHLQRRERLVVNILIDGLEPDLDRIATLRQKRIEHHTLFIETTHPTEMAMEVLTEVEQHLDEADRLKNEAADFLSRNLTPKAMEKLSGAFRTWFHAQESIQKISQLLRLDLGRLQVNGRPMIEQIQAFSEMLKQIKQTLENRDFVLLSDILQYETTETTTQWRQMLDALRTRINANA